jgi:hypothetical protein
MCLSSKYYSNLNVVTLKLGMKVSDIWKYSFNSQFANF